MKTKQYIEVLNLIINGLPSKHWSAKDLGQAYLMKTEF